MVLSLKRNFVMCEDSPTNKFATELDNLIRRTSMEYELEYAQVIGALFIKTVELASESVNDEEDVEDDL